ncbi:MAG TPA: aspartyl protease family protein [Sphingobacteriaceae bacterium]
MSCFRLNTLKKFITLGLLTCFLTPVAYAQKFEFLHNRKKEALPFKFVRNLIIIPVEINGKGPYNFVLDTGVGFCIITEPSLIDTLKPATLRKIKITGFGEGEDLTAHVIPSLQFKIGNTAGSRLPAAVLQKDAFDLSAFAGMPVYGLIGYEFFNSFIVRINYATSLITLYRQHSGFILRKGNRIPMSIEDRKPYINSEIGIKPKNILAKLIIDTGSGHPLSLEMYEGVPFEVPKVHIAANLGIGITGPINGFLGRVDFVRLGKFEIKNVLTAFPDFKDAASKTNTINRAGSIGNNILRRFDVVFDYSRSAMYLKSTASLKAPFEHDMSGMELFSSGEDYKRLFVLRVEALSAAYEAGIQEDDEILAINLKPVSELSREEIDAIFKSQNNRSLIIDLVPKGAKRMERIILTLKRRI